MFGVMIALGTDFWRYQPRSLTNIHKSTISGNVCMKTGTYRNPNRMTVGHILGTLCVIMWCVLCCIIAWFYAFRLLPFIKGNVGLVFTKNDLTEVRDKIVNNKVAAPAKAGAIAPLDVVLPGQNTGLGPEKTSFFQALAIPTKITKGTIEILVSSNISCATMWT